MYLDILPYCFSTHICKIILFIFFIYSFNRYSLSICYVSGGRELRINKNKVPRVVEVATLHRMLRENLSDENLRRHLHEVQVR